MCGVNLQPLKMVSVLINPQHTVVKMVFFSVNPVHTVSYVVRGEGYLPGLEMPRVCALEKANGLMYME